ncbi:hypothetical protein ACHAWC_003378 [Mediolabrus comicus]
MGTLPPSPRKLAIILLPFLVQEVQEHYCCSIYLPPPLNNIIIIIMSSSSSYSEVFESRYAAFIIWSIFVLAFIVVPFLFVPLKFCLARICRLGACLVSGGSHHQENDAEADDYYDDGSRPPLYSVFDVEYAHLSSSKKSRIHEIRSREIKKCLSPFSTLLSEENMVGQKVVVAAQPNSGYNDDELHVPQEKYQGDGEEGEIASFTESSSETSSVEAFASLPPTPIVLSGEDSSETPSEETTAAAASPPTLDEELHISQEKHQGDDDEEEMVPIVLSGEAGYTHISLPHPGYNKYGIRKLKKKPKPSTDEPANKQRMCLVLFRNNKNPVTKDRQAKEILGEEDDDSDVENNTRSKDDRREVPIFCAVCLGEYEVGEKVCWSSNTECTHVFHHDCMKNWLEASGKRASKKQRFSENPTRRQVLNFSMECPCCRQAFVDKTVDLKVGSEGNDENV